MSVGAPFLAQAPPGTIDLGIGQPSADLLPVDLLREASEAFLAEAHPFDLTYGVLEGDERFRASLAAYLSDAYGAPARAESLCVTAGNSHALDLVSNVFGTPGDTVFVEEPTYYLAFRIFHDHGLRVVSIPIDEDGMRVDLLEERLEHETPAFIYVVPSYHNPAGHCMSDERRRRLGELASEHGFLIVADEVYQLLSYDHTPPRAFGTMIEGDNVLSLGTFSKILAPALRLGWIQTGPGLLRRVLRNGYISSGGSVSHYSSHLARHAIELGLREHVEMLRRSYAERVETMHGTLETTFGDLATWREPTGGYFFWLRFADEVDTRALAPRAAELETGFTPGASFSSDGRLGNFLRLSFAHYGADEIVEGIGRLRTVFD